MKTISRKCREWNDREANLTEAISLTTINEGELVPIYCDEVLPGDTAKVHLNGLIRMSTPIYPIMDNCYMDTYFFFVPCRLLWEHWENMFGENDTNYWAEKTEYSTPTCAIGGKSGLNNGTIGDYFGLPTGIKNAIKVNALPARAYAMIYTEWFRDENVEAPLMLGYKKTDEAADDDNPGETYMYANRPDQTTGQALGNTAAYSLTTCSKDMVDYAATEY